MIQWVPVWDVGALQGRPGRVRGDEPHNRRAGRVAHWQLNVIIHLTNGWLAR